MEPTPREYSLNEAAVKIQELITNEGNENWLVAFQVGVSGNEIQAQRCRAIIRDLLDREKITVNGYSSSRKLLRLYISTSTAWEILRSSDVIIQWTKSGLPLTAGYS